MSGFAEQDAESMLAFYNLRFKIYKICNEACKSTARENEDCLKECFDKINNIESQAAEFMKQVTKDDSDN